MAVRRATKEKTLRCPYCDEEMIDEYIVAGEDVKYAERTIETGGLSIHFKVNCHNCAKPIYLTFWLSKISKEPPEIMRGE